MRPKLSTFLHILFVLLTRVVLIFALIGGLLYGLYLFLDWVLR
jgi:hypothetical protein